MGLQYRKRVNLGKGLGLNVSSGGVSASYRTEYGSVGSRGFSIRTGIPGLSWRSSWGKGKNGLIVILIYILVLGGVLVLYNLVLFIIYLVRIIYESIQRWRLKRKINYTSTTKELTINK